MKSVIKINFTCVLLCAGILAMNSCVNDIPNPDAEYYNPDKLVLVDTNVPSVSLCGQHVMSDTSNVHGRIICCDSFLFVTNNPSKSSKLFSIVKASDFSSVVCMGDIGHASNEFLMTPSDVYFRNNMQGEKKMLMMCAPNNELKVFDFQKSISENKCFFEKNIKNPFQMEVNSQFFFYYSIDDSHAISKRGISYDDLRDNVVAPPKFQLYDNGSSTDINLYPSAIGPANYMNLVPIYASWTFVNTDMSKMVEILTNMGIINVIDTKSGKTLGIRLSDAKSFSNYSAQMANMESVELSEYFGRGYASDNYVFALYGRFDMEGFVVSTGEKQELLVLNFDGKLVNKFLLDKPMKSIAYDDASQTLYSLDKDGMGFYKYDLSKYLK